MIYLRLIIKLTKKGSFILHQDAEKPVRHPVIVVGAGPVGLAVALDLGLKGQPVVVLDEERGR